MFESPHICRYRPEMPIDPLSDILRLANARSVITGGVRAGGAWSLRFSAPDKIKFLAISGNSVWLKMDGGANFARTNPGDVLLFSDRRGFILANELTMAPVDASALFAGRLGTIIPLDGGAETQFIGGHVALDPTSGWVVSSVLPPLIHVGATSSEAPMLRWLVGRLVEESSTAQPGGDIANEQIAQLLFVHILRALLTSSTSLPVGILRAAADPHLSRALRLIHAQPGAKWRLAELASAAALSRTVFAERFKAATGVAPIGYVTRWRMLLASRALKNGDTPIGELARGLGYASPSAFSHAFRRVMGGSPSFKVES